MVATRQRCRFVDRSVSRVDIHDEQKKCYSGLFKLSKKWYDDGIDMQFGDTNSFDGNGMTPPGGDEAPWDGFLEYDAFIPTRAKARPNKFLAIGLHFFAEIQESRK